MTEFFRLIGDSLTLALTFFLLFFAGYFIGKIFKYIAYSIATIAVSFDKKNNEQSKKTEN